MARKKKFFAIVASVLFSATLFTGFAMSEGSSVKGMLSPKVASAYFSVNCRCGLLWGDGCSASNYGNGCAPDYATSCSTYNSNCE
ncbi:MAG TPA: hypothetical protein PLS00_00030 [Niabella sp.]|nr:hypothetical protein [Niabella sp.]